MSGHVISKNMDPKNGISMHCVQTCIQTEFNQLETTLSIYIANVPKIL